MFGWLKPAPESAVLDTAYLARLAGHLGQTALDELLADGLIELGDRVTRLAELSQGGEREAMARLGHDLVGMAGHLGLARLSAAAAGLGRRLRGDDPADAAAAVGQVVSEGEAATEALRRYLGN